MLRLRVDEAEGRAELLLSGRLSRAGWLGRQLAVAASSTIVVAVIGGLAAGLGFALAGEAPDRIGTSLATVAVHLPAAMIFISLTALAFAFTPRLTAAIGWGLLVVGLVVGQLGDLIGLPRWVQDISPFRHIPAVPIESVDPVPLVVMGVIAAGAALGAVVGLRRRDVPA